MNKKFRAKYFIRSFVRGYWRELIQNIQYPFQTKENSDTKFVIFTGGRTGSTLLVSLLNSNPDIHCEGEILNGRVLRPYAFLQKQEAKITKPVYGFKLLSYQLRDIQSSINDKRAFLEKLIKEGYKIIHIDRENKVYQTLSVMYAMYKDHWHLKENKTKPFPKMDLEVEDFEKTLGEMESLFKFELEVLKGLPYLRISYEKDLENASQHPITIQKISDFLGVPASFPETNLRKILPSNISRFVNNAEELTTYLEKVGEYEFSK